MHDQKLHFEYVPLRTRLIHEYECQKTERNLRFLDHLTSNRISLRITGRGENNRFSRCVASLMFVFYELRCISYPSFRFFRRI